MNSDPLSSFESRGTTRLQRFVAAWVIQLGVPLATTVVAIMVALVSLGLTRLWLSLQGAEEMGEAFLIAVCVPLPISFVVGGWTLHLIASLERARRQVAHLAITDPLTGLRNRRHFMHCATAQFELARRHNTPLALMLFDVDHFKRINDQHGHLEGDRLLSQIGQQCQALMRASDLLARFGGEEFIVLLPNTRQDQAVRLAERMRHEVARIGGQSTVTVSVGVVERGPEHADLSSLIRDADEALYAAKRGGRDRVHTQPVSLSVLGTLT